MTIADHVAFLGRFLASPRSVGAVAPSSPALVKMMVDWFDWQTHRTIIEYGPGTGVFTEAIQRQRHAESRFFAVELSETLAQRVRLRCPQVDVHQGSVVDIAKICRDRSIDSIDAIVCGLPWAAFPEPLQDDVLDATMPMLPAGAKFATFAYLQGLPLPAGRRFAKKLRARFAKVQTSPVVWRNVPPALIYRCIA